MPLDGWAHGFWMDGGTDGGTDGRTDGRMVERWMGGWMGGATDRRMGGRADDGWTDKCMAV